MSRSVYVLDNWKAATAFHKPLSSDLLYSAFLERCLICNFEYFMDALDKSGKAAPVSNKVLLEEFVEEFIADCLLLCSTRKLMGAHGVTSTFIYRTGGLLSRLLSVTLCTPQLLVLHTFVAIDIWCYLQ